MVVQVEKPVFRIGAAVLGVFSGARDGLSGPIPEG